MNSGIATRASNSFILRHLRESAGREGAKSVGGARTGEANKRGLFLGPPQKRVGPPPPWRARKSRPAPPWRARKSRPAPHGERKRPVRPATLAPDVRNFASQSMPKKSFAATSPHLGCCNKLKKSLRVIRGHLGTLRLGTSSGPSGDFQLTRSTQGFACADRGSSFLSEF